MFFVLTIDVRISPAGVKIELGFVLIGRFATVSKNVVFSGFAVAPLPMSRSSRSSPPITRFGAKPDDQLDDAAAIQNAIDAAGKAGGGIVVVPRGEFRIQPPTEAADAALWIKHSGVVLRGTVGGGRLVSLINTWPQMRRKQVIPGDAPAVLAALPVS